MMDRNGNGVISVDLRMVREQFWGRKPDSGGKGRGFRLDILEKYVGEYAENFIWRRSRERRKG